MVRLEGVDDNALCHVCAQRHAPELYAAVEEANSAVSLEALCALSPNASLLVSRSVSWRYGDSRDLGWCERERERRDPWDEPPF